MRRLIAVRFLLVLSFLFAGLALPGVASASTAQTYIPAVSSDASQQPSSIGPQTYTVLVGAEDVARKVGVMSYFPSTLHVHVGDTVVWKQNTHEIHTVTFLAGAPMPLLIEPTPQGFTPAGLMLNPQVAFPAAPANGMYDGSTYANSGIMSTDPGQPTQFSLTFTTSGTYEYLCVVHGMMMSGKVVVDLPSTIIPSPATVSAQAQRTITQELSRAYELIGLANAQVPAPRKNADGSSTYTVLIGYSKGPYDLMSFFPDKLAVKPGDTVNFALGQTNMAPHTVTFLNGAPDISFIIPIPNPPGPPVLLINPQVLMPINSGKPLTRTGIFSSGLLDPTGPGPYSWPLKIGNISGNISYECLLHDTSGMDATLSIVTFSTP